MKRVSLIAMVDGWPSLRINTLRHLGAKARPSFGVARTALLQMMSPSLKGKGKGREEVWGPLDDEYGTLDSILDEKDCIESVHDRLTNARKWCQAEVLPVLALKCLTSRLSLEGTYLERANVDRIHELAFSVALPAGVAPTGV